MTPRYWAFISYSHRDAKWASWLHRALESYRPPRALVGTPTPRGPVPRRLTPVFRDREELASATDLGAVISEALAESRCQIVICSPHAAQSKWVNEEILAFKRLGREDCIFCLIVDGEPNATDLPGRAHEECFPPALRFRLGPDGALSEARTEPIAADARPGKDGKQGAKLKLIAGALAVGFDALRRREAQRRNRRLALVATAATIGMVVTSGLAGYALLQKRAAERQQRRAEAEAETARQTTSFLVDLFRISDPSEARGNAVTAREMLDKGAARIDRELERQPAIRATLQDTVGTVYMGLGLYREARTLLDRAVVARRRLDAANPGPLGESLVHLADLLTVQGEYDDAERTYREAIRYTAAQPPGGPREATRARALHGLGVVLERLGRYPEAEQTLAQAIEAEKTAFGPVHNEVARTLQDLARVVDEAGDYGRAVDIMQRSLAMQRALNGSQPHPGLAEAINDLAALDFEGGNYDGAEALWREALAMERKLLGDKHAEIATTLNNLGLVLHAKGDLAGTESAHRQALAMRRELFGEAHPDVAQSLNNLALVEFDRGSRAEAIATERECLAIYRRLFPGDHPDVAGTMNRLAFWLTETGRYDEARRAADEALAMRRRLFDAQHPAIGSSLEHLAILEVALHRYEAGRAAAHDAVAILSAAFSDAHWRTAIAESAEGAALGGLGRYAEAEARLVHSVAVLDKPGAAPLAYRALAHRYLAALRAGGAPGHAGRGAEPATAGRR